MHDEITSKGTGRCWMYLACAYCLKMSGSSVAWLGDGVVGTVGGARRR